MSDEKILNQKKKRRWKFVFFGVELFFLVVMVLAIAAWGKFSDFYQVIEKESEFENDSDAGINNDINTETIEVLKGYTNIALFGLDSRKDGYNGGHSDSIIIASINNETKEVKLVSVYRDTYLSIGGGKFKKANNAYASGGARQAVQMLNSNFDLDITEYVCVNWKALIEAIDALGGVEIDITKKEVEYINKYVSDMHKEIGSAYDPVSGEGKKKLSGVQATAYARIRYTSGDDFKRSSRQRIVIEAMLNKAKKSDLNTLLKVCEEVFDDISTTLSMGEILDLAMDVASYDVVSTTGFPFRVTCKTLPSLGSIVIPIDLADNVDELHEYLFGNADYEPSYSVKMVGDAIITRTGVDKNETPINMDKWNETAGQDGTVFD